MRSFQLTRLLDEVQRTGRAWLEFLREPSLSLGVYHLKAGAVDRQQPHTEDEVYYVASGRGRFRVGDEEQEVRPGTVLFVSRLIDHRFFDISEDLTVLVMFAPPEGSLADVTASLPKLKS